MNLNLHFEITSDQDVVLDRRNTVTPTILMEPDFTTSQQGALLMGRLKEFYPEAWESNTQNQAGEQDGAAQQQEQAPKKKEVPNLLKPNQIQVPLPVLD